MFVAIMLLCRNVLGSGSWEEDDSVYSSSSEQLLCRNVLGSYYNAADLLEAKQHPSSHRKFLDTWNADKDVFIQEWWTRTAPIAPEHKAGALRVCATIDKASMRRLEIDNAWPTQFTEKENEAWKKENEAWKKREIDRAYGVFIETHFNNSEKKALKENLAVCLPVPVTQTKTVWIKRNTNWFSPSMWYRKLASMWYKSPTVVRKVVSTVSMWSSSPNGPYTIGPHDTIRPEGLIGWKVELTGDKRP